MNDRECKTQSDVDAAIRAGERVILRDTAHAVLYNSASAVLYNSASAVLYNSASAIEGRTSRALQQSRPVVLLGPIGSRDKMLSVYQCADGGILVRAGCFLGSRDEFAAAVAKTHPTGQYADEYRAALLMIDALAAANAAQREAE